MKHMIEWSANVSPAARATFQKKYGKSRAGWEVCYVAVLPKVAPDVIPGEAILKVVPCYVCDKPTTTRCSRCSGVNYCSRECRRADWPRHKKECIDSGKTGKDKSVDDGGNKALDETSVRVHFVEDNAMKSLAPLGKVAQSFSHTGGASGNVKYGSPIQHS